MRNLLSRYTLQQDITRSPPTVRAVVQGLPGGRSLRRCMVGLSAALIAGCGLRAELPADPDRAVIGFDRRVEALSVDGHPNAAEVVQLPPGTHTFVARSEDKIKGLIPLTVWIECTAQFQAEPGDRVTVSSSRVRRLAEEGRRLHQVQLEVSGTGSKRIADSMVCDAVCILKRGSDIYKSACATLRVRGFTVEPYVVVTP